MAAILELDDGNQKNFKVGVWVTCAMLCTLCTMCRSCALCAAPGICQLCVSAEPPSANPAAPPPLRSFPTQVFEAAPQEARGVPAKKAAPDYFL